MGFQRVPDLDWRIVGTGDFDRDGNLTSSGATTGAGTTGSERHLVHERDGQGTMGILETVFSQVLDLNWQIAGAGDFDGDANVDILWRNQGDGTYQGLNVIWYMTGTTKGIRKSS